MHNTLKIGLWDSFENLDDLELKLFDYVNRFNNVRLHGSPGYRNPDPGMDRIPFRYELLAFARGFI